MKKNKIIIIGAGLSGLLLGAKLKEIGIPFLIIEGKEKEGGRILTVEETKDSPPMEMGAMWFLKGIHLKTQTLLKKLKINSYPQYLEGTVIVESATHFPVRDFNLKKDNAQSYRIENGNHSLIKKLSDIVGTKNIVFNTTIKKIKYDNGYTLISKNNEKFAADLVVTTLPPNLLVNSIKFSPELPKSLTDLAKNSMTWKAQATKFSVSYKKPFWRENGFSGLAYSNKRPIVEVYDHSNYKDSKYSLMGFVAGLDKLSKGERKQQIIDHLIEFYGSEASNYISYHEKIWADDPFVNYNSIRLPYPEKQNIGKSEYTKNLFNETLIIGGTETSQGEWAGYLEGAIDSTDRVFTDIMKKIVNTTK